MLLRPDPVAASNLLRDNPLGAFTPLWLTEMDALGGRMVDENGLTGTNETPRRAAPGTRGRTTPQHAPLNWGPQSTKKARGQPAPPGQSPSLGTRERKRVAFNSPPAVKFQCARRRRF